MSQPLVSIAVLAYNQEAFIAETVESALAQTYPNFEVVVADDGSKDGTVEVVKRLAARHKQLRLVASPVNRGLTPNSNVALKACNGELVAFLGGDDILLPEKVSRQVDWMVARPERVLCGHDVEHFDSDSGRRLLLHSQIVPLSSGRGPKQILEQGGSFCATIAVMARRSAMPAYGFDERLPMVSDIKLWIDCLMGGGEYGFVDGVLARYRRAGWSVSIAQQDRCHVESFMTLAIVEAEHPEYARSCSTSRSRLHHRRGVAMLLSGDAKGAQTELLHAVTSKPFRSAKAPVWLALTALPQGVRSKVIGRLT